MVTRDVIIEMRNRNECMENEGKAWSNEDSQALSFYYETGYGITEIAVILQRSERAVYQQLVLMGAFQSPVKRTFAAKAHRSQNNCVMFTDRLFDLTYCVCDNKLDNM